MKVSDIVKKLEPIKSHIEKDSDISGAFLDSRLVTSNSIFFAYKGEKTDGNIYCQKALDNGACVVIMDNEDIYNDIKGNKILVENSLDYMQELGRIRFDELHKLNKKVIAITGSFGKTGTKEMLKTIFSQQEKVYATYGNKNNLLGVLLTGCGIDDTADIIIIELGSNNFGEISELSKIVKPSMAIVTNVGHAHIGRFKTFERLLFEKMSISDGLSENGEFIIPIKLTPFVPKGDFKFRTFGESDFSGIRMVEFNHMGEFIKFKTNLIDKEFIINHPYMQIAENSLASIYAALLLNIKEDNIYKGLYEYKVASGHGSFEKIGDIFLIDDSYNAGFESFIKSAESLSLMNYKEKYVIFGEMGEIEGYEEDLYNEITQLAYLYPDINFYLVGKSYELAEDLENRKIFSSKADCIEEVKKIKSGAVIVKAARAYQFEDIVEEIRKN